MCFVCTQHIRDGCSAYGITFESTHQASRFDITNCFNPKSEEGKLIVDFLSHTVDLRGTAPPELHQEFLDFLGGKECSEKQEDGTILFNNDWDALIAQKQAKKA
uniref:histamine N-methyltransferase-like n=1 Tax=Myxine glutinosa TaxID=7769 RepID=UPI00358EE365